MATDSTVTVYVIDDDEPVRDSVKAMLESHSYRVIDFASGSDFLRSRAAGQAGCLLLDLHMPGMTGLHVLADLRGRGDRIPAILITGRPDPEAQSAAMALGGVKLLSKPFTRLTLIAAVGEALAGDSRGPANR